MLAFVLPMHDESSKVSARSETARARFPSLSDTRLTFRSRRSSKKAVSPDDVRPGRSIRQQTTRDTRPIWIASVRLFQSGRSIVRPVNLSQYHTPSPSCPAAHRFKSGSCEAVS